LTASPSELFGAGINTSYIKSSPGAALVSQTFRFRLFERWYLRGRVGYRATGSGRMNYDRFDFYDRELEVVRDMHCFILSMTYRQRGAAEEVMFDLKLKMDYYKKQRIQAAFKEQEFYPWR